MFYRRLGLWKPVLALSPPVMLSIQSFFSLCSCQFIFSIDPALRDNAVHVSVSTLGVSAQHSREVNEGKGVERPMTLRTMATLSVAIIPGQSFSIVARNTWSTWGEVVKDRTAAFIPLFRCCTKSEICWKRVSEWAPLGTKSVVDPFHWMYWVILDAPQINRVWKMRHRPVHTLFFF